MTITLRQVAINYLSHHKSLDSALSSLSGMGSPSRAELPGICVVLNNCGQIWNVDKRVVIKSGEIGVGFDWDDGRQEYAVFSVRELWHDMTTPIQQLRLFE